MLPLSSKDAITGRVNEAIPQIQKIFSRANAVGMSIGVVHEGETLLKLHMGYRNLESRQSADDDTRYSLNSVTKGVIALLVGVAHHEQKLDFDSPVRDYLPEFRSADQVVEERATILDFLANRTGISGNDAYWLGSQNAVLLDKSQLLVSFATFTPMAPFRTSFVYNNWGYAIVGLVLETVYGKSLNSLLQEKLFKPLGMSRSGTNWGLDENEIKAYQILQDETAVEVVPPQLTEGVLMEAAGGVKSSLGDLLIYCNALLEATVDQFENAQDETDGSVFKNVRTVLTGQVRLLEGFLREQSYAAGWVRGQLPGPLGLVGSNPGEHEMPIVGKGAESRLALYHNGLMPGSLSAIYFFPETRTGVVVLQNSLTANDAADLVGQVLVQSIFPGTQPIDFAEFGDEVAKASYNSMEAIEKELKDQRGDEIVDPGDRSDYIGTYWNRIRNFRVDILEGETDQALKIQFQQKPEELYDMQPYNGDTFTWFATSHDDIIRRGRLLPDGSSIYILRFQRNENKTIIGFDWAWSEFVPEVLERFSKLDEKAESKVSLLSRRGFYAHPLRVLLNLLTP